MREQEQADGEAAIRLLREHLQDRNVVVQDLLMFSDDIARAMLNTAVEREVTLIVLGLTGQERLRPAARRERAGRADQEHHDPRPDFAAGLQPDRLTPRRAAILR